MPTSQEHITSNTPMGANLVPGGATFRVFAPNARAVYVNGNFDGVELFSPGQRRLFFTAQKGSAKFLDVLDKVDHLVRLGINAVEPLPVDEVE